MARVERFLRFPGANGLAQEIYITAQIAHCRLSQTLCNDKDFSHLLATLTRNTVLLVQQG